MKRKVKTKQGKGKTVPPQDVDQPEEPAPQDAEAPKDESPPPADQPAEESPSTEVTESEESLQERVSALEEQVARARADYCNLERRLATERAEAVRFANAELIRALLPVLDDFERSLAAARDTDNVASLVDGERLIQANLLKVLTDNGLARIEALHQPFDPHVHEALLQTPNEEHPPHTVLEEVSRGYRLRERVLRPAQVVVSQANEPAPADGDHEENLDAQNEAAVAEGKEDNQTGQ